MASKRIKDLPEGTPVAADSLPFDGTNGTKRTAIDDLAQAMVDNAPSNAVMGLTYTVVSTWT